MKKKGFSLVELMVVMSIIAALSVISISALINANSGVIVDSAAEKILSEIRDTQNKSISVVRNRNDANNYPLVWSLAINPENYSTFSLNLQSGSITQVQEKATTTYEGRAKATVRLDGNVYNGPLYINFTSPFGKLYATTETCSNGVGNCVWNKKTSLVGDYEPTLKSDPSKTENIFNNVQEVAIEFNLKDKFFKKVILKANGDSYIE